jgi:hypothetical protein
MSQAEQQVLKKAGRVYASCRTDAQWVVFKRYKELVTARTKVNNLLGNKTFMRGFADHYRETFSARALPWS